MISIQIHGRARRRVASLALPMVAWLLLGAAAARADEIGGTRSIFSEGAGNRALAMGSAFSAVADDASALLWNAGGLGRLSRFEVQAGQTSYFALDMNESYLAAAAPSWRWGTAALAFRHFGTAGIEQRDDRNVLVSSNLEDSETELALGYARPLGDALSLGGGLKLRRQSLAGLSASAFGLDVGMLAQPAQWLGSRGSLLQNVTWGLSLHNLVQPSMRLDRESVADPRAVRSGFAYHRDLGIDRALIAAIDLENADGATHWHSGVELKLEPLLALRFGLDGGAMTAGTGLKWHDLAIDYAYQQTALDDVHRLGLTYAFGATVSQSREAARRAEENALQSRLAEAFQRRQAEQITAMFQEIEDHLARQEYDAALDRVAMVNALDPGDPKIAALEVRCLKTKAHDLEARSEMADAAATFGRARALAPADSEAVEGERRCQAESDARAERSADLRRQFAKAIDDFGADRLADARAGFREILKAEPGDVEAAAMLARTDLAIARRSQGLVQQGNRYLRSGMLNEAAQAVDQVRALDRNAEGLAALESGLARARQSAGDSTRSTIGRAEPARPAPAPRKLGRQQVKELDLLYKRGLDAMAHNRSDDALRCWELVWSTDPTYLNVATYLKREYLTRGMEAFAAGRLDDAVGFWEKALQIDPKDARTIGYLDRAQKQLARTREILGNGH